MDGRTVGMTVTGLGYDLIKFEQKKQKKACVAGSAQHAPDSPTRQVA